MSKRPADECPRPVVSFLALPGRAGAPNSRRLKKRAEALLEGRGNFGPAARPSLASTLPMGRAETARDCARPWNGGPRHCACWTHRPPGPLNGHRNRGTESDAARHPRQPATTAVGWSTHNMSLFMVWRTIHPLVLDSERLVAPKALPAEIRAISRHRGPISDGRIDHADLVA